MDYRIFSKLSGEDENSIEAHVLARAYRAVWRCTHGCEPVGQHQIAGLELVIDYGGLADVRSGIATLRPAATPLPTEDSSAKDFEAPAVTDESSENDFASDV